MLQHAVVVKIQVGRALVCFPLENAATEGGVGILRVSGCFCVGGVLLVLLLGGGGPQGRGPEHLLQGGGSVPGGDCEQVAI